MTSTPASNYEIVLPILLFADGHDSSLGITGKRSRYA